MYQPRAYSTRPVAASARPKQVSPLVDGNTVQWWGWKDSAQDGARAIGWPLRAVSKVQTRFQHGYALVQEGTGEYLTKAAYAALLEDRNRR